uniref:Uncharacterized protein n=1 Tax=Globodera rostochiensis TaxID=31243 RepID=A0A914H5R9_GLORO
MHQTSVRTSPATVSSSASEWTKASELLRDFIKKCAVKPSVFREQTEKLKSALVLGRSEHLHVESLEEKFGQNRAAFGDEEKCAEDEAKSQTQKSEETFSFTVITVTI